MKRFLKEYFSFTKSERNGILILVSIIILLVFFQQFLYLFKNESEIDFSEFEKEIDEFESSLIELKENTAFQYDNYEEENDVNLDTMDFFFFDPNKISENEWKQLGLSDKLIKTILNYRNKGGKFYKSEDLKKMYGMNIKLFDTLKHYITIESFQKNYNYQNNNYNNKKQWEKKPWDNKYQYNNITVNLNTADTLELTKVYGIGNTFSKRITAYRNLLGGYIRIEQLNEIYGMTPETYEMIKDHLIIDTLKINKINLNKAEFKDLIRHPYIDKNTASTIIKYRDKANIIYSINELVENKIISNDAFTKIKSYLSTE